MIGDLERDWGIPLLERSRAGVRLTPDGARLLPYVQNLCRDCQELSAQVDSIRGLQTGFLRIGTFSSVATHWLPNIIRAFQKDLPGIDYELLLGDYTEIDTWIAQGQVDCGFLRMPVRPEYDAMVLERDRFLAVLPEDHPLARLERVPLAALCSDPFLLLAKGANAEILELFEEQQLKPRVHFTTWDDYAIMSMVEGGLGVSILPELILRRIPYRIAIRELDVPAYRTICLALRDRKTASLAVRRFLDYLPCRSPVSQGENTSPDTNSSASPL